MTDLWPQLAAARINLAEESNFDLGGMRVRPAELAVEMNGERHELQPRVMKVLVALALARPAVVSRDKLIELCWEGRVVGDDALNRCVLALRHLAQEFSPEPFAIETVPRIGHRLVEHSAMDSGQAPPAPRRWVRPVIACIVIALLGLAVWLIGPGRWPWGFGPRVPTVRVAAAANDRASRELAHDLTAELGEFEAARSTSMRLMDEAAGSSREPDLILEARRIADPAAAVASLVLKAGPDRSILWSKEFKQPSRNLADLRQQVAFTAARVLGCATEGLEANLRQRALKTYLNGCAAQADLFGREAESVIPMFRQVLQDAPRFEGAWAKLLLAGSEVFQHTDSIEARNRLKADAAAAKTVNPKLPEIYLAESDLLPGTAYAERMRLVNRAVELKPESAVAYAMRAQALQMVGRMRDSVGDTQRAMQLDPLSPWARSNYIFALGVAGHYDTARHELREAERLWPGSRNVAFARAYFNLRYGDPRQAWDFLRSEPSEDWMNAQSYLEARIDRTPEKIDRAVQDAQGLYRRAPGAIQQLAQVYGEFGLEKELLELLLKAPNDARNYAMEFTFRQPVVDFWDDPRSLIVAKRAGLLEYWRQSGRWPDFCFAPDLPYDCKAEAAKLD